MERKLDEVHRLAEKETHAFVASPIADFQISVKDFSRRETLTVHLMRREWSRQFFVRMNGKKWPANGRPVSLSKVFAALRKAVVKRAGVQRSPLTKPR